VGSGGGQEGAARRGPERIPTVLNESKTPTSVLPHSLPRPLPGGEEAPAQREPKVARRGQAPPSMRRAPTQQFCFDGAPAPSPDRQRLIGVVRIAHLPAGVNIEWSPKGGGRMRLRVLGCSGGYPTPESASTGDLLEEGETRIWLDAGNGTFSMLQRYADFRRLDAMVISHL